MDNLLVYLKDSTFSGWIGLILETGLRGRLDQWQVRIEITGFPAW